MRRLLILALSTLCLAAQQDAGRVNIGHKAAHFSIGFGIAWGGGVAGYPKTGLAIGVGLGLAKEYYDNRQGETWSSQKRDIIITGTGAILGYLVARHYYPHGADLGGHDDLASMTLDQRNSWDKREMAFLAGLQ